MRARFHRWTGGRPRRRRRARAGRNCSTARPTPDREGILHHRGAAMPPLPFDRDLSVIGPMARSAADLALLLDVIAGPDPMEAGKAYTLALPAPRHRELKNFRVLVLDSDPVMPTAAVIRNAIAKLAANLGKSGVTVTRELPL